MVSRGGTTDPMLGVATSSSTNSRVALYNGYDLDTWNDGAGTDYLVFDVQQSSGNSAVQHLTDTFHAGIWQVIWSATGTESAYDGSMTASGTNSLAIANYGIYIGQSDRFTGSDVVDWGRMRAYPPGNVMPSTSFGSVGGGSGAPTSVTDMLGDSFTLGVSTSTSGSAPTLVQKNYNANCASASCQLAFTQNVVAGNTLVFALGWYGQNPPSTPTDTRLDTFTLGASNNVVPSAIAVDNSASSNVNSDGSGHVTISFTVGTGTNRLLIVGETVDNSAITGVTYGGTALTQAVADTQKPTGSIWYLVNPPSGTASVVVSSSPSKGAILGLISFTGVDQSTPIPTTATNDNANGRTSPATVSITNANANAWVMELVASGHIGGFTNGASTP